MPMANTAVPASYTQTHTHTELQLVLNQHVYLLSLLTHTSTVPDIRHQLTAAPPDPALAGLHTQYFQFCFLFICSCEKVAVSRIQILSNIDWFSAVAVVIISGTWSQHLHSVHLIILCNLQSLCFLQRTVRIEQKSGILTVFFVRIRLTLKHQHKSLHCEAEGILQHF